MKEEKGTGAEAESQSQLVAKEDNKGMVKRSFYLLFYFFICLSVIYTVNYFTYFR